MARRIQRTRRQGATGAEPSMNSRKAFSERMFIVQLA